MTTWFACHGRNAVACLAVFGTVSVPGHDMHAGHIRQTEIAYHTLARLPSFFYYCSHCDMSLTSTLKRNARLSYFFATLECQRVSMANRHGGDSRFAEFSGLVGPVRQHRARRLRLTALHSLQEAGRRVATCNP